MAGKLIPVLVCAGFLAAGALGQSSGASRESLLNFSITGYSTSNSPADNATYAMRRLEVQRLLLDVAASPRDPRYVEAALRGSGISLADMVSNGSLRLDQGRYWLNFALLTRTDQERIIRAAEVYSGRLAEAVLARRVEIQAQLASYDLPGIDRRAIAFLVLGCFSLDWDGLDFATRNGYRAATPERKGGRFFFMAEERGGPSLKGIYWGSHNSVYEEFGFTSFGDHFSPRLGLSSLRSDGRVELREMPVANLAAYAGSLMLALRVGPQHEDALAGSAKLPRDRARALLAGLEKIGYVRKDGERYRAAIPVFAERDKAMIAALRSIGLQAIKEWFARNYEPLRKDMRDITPLRHNVPFPVVFDQLWHYVFGIANRKLVEAGLFADPYAPAAAHVGYLPVVYSRGVEMWSGR